MSLPFLRIRSLMVLVEHTSAAIAAAPDEGGSRLKRIRTRRQLTLTDPADTTGISKSTLSRLENG